MAISIKNNRLRLKCRHAIVNWIIYVAVAALVVFVTAKFWMLASDKSSHSFVYLFSGFMLVVAFYKLWHSAMKERIVELDIDHDTGTLNVDRKGLLFSDARHLPIDDIARIQFRTLSWPNEGLFYRASIVLSDGDEVFFANGIVRDWVVAPAEKVVKFLRRRRADLRLEEVSG